MSDDSSRNGHSRSAVDAKFAAVFAKEDSMERRMDALHEALVDLRDAHENDRRWGLVLAELKLLRESTNEKFSQLFELLTDDTRVAALETKPRTTRKKRK